MIYLASPYSPVTEEEKRNADKVREDRYRKTMAAQSQLFNEGYPVFATIVHTHVTAKHYNLPTEAAHWIKYNHHMIDLSLAIFILELPGWQESIGVQDEINYAHSQGIPAYNITVSEAKNGTMFGIPIIPELQTLLRVHRQIMRTYNFATSVSTEL